MTSDNIFWGEPSIYVIFVNRGLWKYLSASLCFFFPYYLTYFISLQVRPTHRVLLPQGHQQIHAMPLNTGGMGHGLMQNAPRQSNLFSQQYQQMVPSHQYPPQFTSLQTQQQPMMRPQYNPMVVYSTEQQQQQQQSGHHLAQQTFPKRKSSAIKIIDPDTNTEVIGTGEQQQHPPPFGITPSTPSSAGATSYSKYKCSESQLSEQTGAQRCEMFRYHIINGNFCHKTSLRFSDKNINDFKWV